MRHNITRFNSEIHRTAPSKYYIIFVILGVCVSFVLFSRECLAQSGKVMAKSVCNKRK